MWNYFPFPADVQLTTTKVGGWATATRGRDQTNYCSPSSCWYNEVCFRSPARRLSDDRLQLTKSQSFPREKQLLSTLNRRQTFSFALVLYLADGKWTISRCKAYRRISSIFFPFFKRIFKCHDKHNSFRTQFLCGSSATYRVGFRRYVYSRHNLINTDCAVVNCFVYYK